MPDDQPLSVRLLGAGVRGAREFGRATGIDRAVESAAEEAMVAAVESEAVERALSRVLNGPLVEDAVHGALESEAVKRALVEALDSEMVDEVWRRMLASEEAQRLVERIAEAPEIRAAISAQSVGFIEDIGHTIGNTTRRIDGVIENGARRATFRKRRAAPTERAGALTRLLAFGLDLLIVNLAFSGLAAVLALIASFFTGSGNGLSGPALAFGGVVWIGLAASTWSSSGRWPARRSACASSASGWERRPAAWRREDRCGDSPGCSSPRSPFGIGFLGILFDERRRGWEDRLSGVDVLYESNEPAAAPWSTLEAPDSPAAAAPSTTKAPGARGLRPHVSG